MPERRMVPLEGALSTFRAVVSRALAEALITGIDNAEAEGRPLLQVQQTHLATMTVMAYGDAIEAADRALSFEATLVEIAGREAPPKSD